MKVHKASRLVPLFLALLLLVGLWGLLGGRGQPAHAWPEENSPHATVKVWDTLIPLGATPGESVEDAAGLTRHGTGKPTIATVYARSTHLEGLTGISYWNPDENVFVWYGKTMGYPSGVDLNRGGPVQPGGPFGTSFGPGDVWIASHALEPLIVHLAGTDAFRAYGTTGAPGEMPSGQVWGVEVDETTGMGWLAQPGQGRFSRVDPVTGQVFFWQVDCHPAYVTLDGAGRPYATLSGCTDGTQHIVRIDNPGREFTSETMLDTVSAWQVPSLGGTPSFTQVPPPLFVPLVTEENPNGLIAADNDGNIWFAESNSNEIGRLSGGPDGIIGTADDVICEFTKPGLLNPQQITTTGSGDLLQVYFTEGDGNSVSVLTQVEADRAGPPTRVCTTVPVQTATVFTIGVVTEMFDEAVTPLETVISPTVHDVPGLDGSASGTTTTANGQPIPPILRFSPMPNPLMSAYGTPIGDAGNGFPSGLTGVYGTNRVAGAYLRANKHFEVTSGASIAPPPPPMENNHEENNDEENNHEGNEEFDVTSGAIIAPPPLLSGGLLGP